MTYTTPLYICVLALILPALAQSLPQQTDKSTILILGDSLSAAYGIKKEEGWVALLEKKLKVEGHDYDVVNASISGETTGGGVARLPALLTQYNPDILVIELGANDGLRGFPIKLIKNNLNTMISLGKKNRVRVFLIGTELPLNYGSRYSNLYAKTFQAVSQAQKIPLAPSLLGKVPLDNDLMQKDALHPNAAAQTQLLEHVWPYLQPILAARASHQ